MLLFHLISISSSPLMCFCRFYEQSMPIPRLDPGLLSSPRLCAHPSAAASAAALHYLLPHPPPSPLQASHTINFSSSSSQGASQRYGSTPRSSLRGHPSSVPAALPPSALVLGDLAAMGKYAFNSVPCSFAYFVFSLVCLCFSTFENIYLLQEPDNEHTSVLIGALMPS